MLDRRARKKTPQVEPRTHARLARVKRKRGFASAAIIASLVISPALPRSSSRDDDLRKCASEVMSTAPSDVVVAVALMAG
jgi:hypothetical protein